MSVSVLLEYPEHIDARNVEAHDVDVHVGDGVFQDGTRYHGIFVNDYDVDEVFVFGPVNDDEEVPTTLAGTLDWIAEYCDLLSFSVGGVTYWSAADYGHADADPAIEREAMTVERNGIDAQLSRAVGAAAAENAAREAIGHRRTRSGEER